MRSPAIVDLNEVALQIETMLRRTVGENIDFVTKLAPNLKKIRVDPGHIHQVILNLVVNARDAMPAGGTLLMEPAEAVSL